MHAIVVREPGGPEVLEWVEVPDPVAGDGEVVVEVAAAGLNMADVGQRLGLYPPPEGASPYPGLEVSGRILEVGPGVTGWAVGDQVCALLDGGGYAERVAVPAGQLLPVPKGVALVAAAALPEAVCTVWSNIVMRAALAAGQTLLVHGGAGGMGSMAIQVGKALGARVVCTAGGPKRAEFCQSLGADQAIDYRTEDFVEYGPYDVIFDIMGGGQYLRRNVQALATGGRITVIGIQGGSHAELDLLTLSHKRGAIHATTLRARPREEKAQIVAAVRAQLWPHVQAGTVRPVIDRTLPMPQAAAAHQAMETGGHQGKILLTR